MDTNTISRHIRSRPSSALLLAVSLLWSSGCQNDQPTESTPEDFATSLQMRLIEAKPGEVIEIALLPHSKRLPRALGV